MASAPAVGLSSSASGFSLAELVITLAIVSLTSGVAVPLVASTVDAGRARQGAGFIAARFQQARQRAIFTSRAVGVVFDRTGDRWTFRVCDDGNGNGIRRADIQAGTDRCVNPSTDVARAFPGVDVSVDPTLPGLDGEPASADAVRFGRSDIASFSPEGTGTAGTVFLRSSRGRQYAIRLSNVTGRTRVLRFDPGTRTWIAA